MGFKFGGIKENQKPKDLLASGKQQDFVIYSHFNESAKNYFIVLLDKFPRSDQLSSLQKMLLKNKMESYFILSAVNIQYQKENLHGSGLTDFVCSHRSGWRKYLNWNSKHCEAILAFGPAIYSINNCADLLASDFYENQMGRSYYYIGHANFAYDTYVYPIDSIDDCWPLLDKKYSTLSNVNFKTRFGEMQIIDAIKLKHQEWHPDLRERKRIICHSTEECNQVFIQNMNADLVAFDTETNGFKFYENKIHCLTICWDGLTGYYMPWRFVNKRLLAKNLMSCKRQTGANPKFDLKFMWFSGVSRQVTVTDAMDRLSHVLFSDRVVGLKPLSYLYTSFGGYDLKLDDYKKKTNCEDYSTIPDEILSQYAVDDAIATWQVQVELDKQCDWIDQNFPNEKFPDWTIRRWYETQLMPIYRDVCNVEYQGIYIDTELMDKYRKEMLELILKKRAELIELWKLPKDFNLSSNVELGRLFERMGWTCYGRTVAGDYMTDENAMLAWKRENRPGVATLLELRTIQTTMNSFLGQEDEKGNKTGWLQYIYSHPDGIKTIQQSYDIMGTESFRFKGKNPNFQNLPARSPYAKYIKKSITTPPADLYIITADSGHSYHLAEFEQILTQDGYKLAKDVLETDTIIEDSSSPVVRRCTIDRQQDGSYQLPDKFWFEKISA